MSSLSRHLRPSLLTLSLLAVWQSPYAQQAPVTELHTITVSAEAELKQALGSSIIDAEDISKRPPSNDLSEIIRSQPGINLTGNSTSGQRGNNRQIDIRGMGPENTLILIDGKPVASRNAVRFGWRGERDTRGDTNWVPAEEVDRIEILRGPAAARYGSGAAGGVVNIITKGVSDDLSGSATVYYKRPQHSDEGATKRLGFNVSGPLSDQLGFRVYGNLNKTNSDAFDINKNHASTPRLGTNAGSYAAGREGVRNKDISALFSWQPSASHRIDAELGFSRQGNIYTGDTQNTNHDRGTEARPGKNLVGSNLGAETNRMYRQNYSLTHKGNWNDSTDTLSYIQYENTRNTRLSEGLAGGTEGLFDTGSPVNIDLKTVTLHSELTTETNWLNTPQVTTVGLEWVNQRLNDHASDLKATNNIQGPNPNYSGKASANLYSMFVESNLYIGERTTLTPGIRLDHHNKQGSSVSPSLNLSQELTDNWTLKAGIARAYKAPNLYQSNSEYVLYSRGLGCAGGGSGGGCFLVGNPNLKAENSINKEIGFEYAADNGSIASLTYFRNDYKNKVEAESTILNQHTTQVGPNTLIADVYQWSNIPKAVVQGLEGNLSLPLHDALWWRTNLTYMLESKNKHTGDYLSVIPKYTINSSLDWQLNEKWSVLGQVTVYGEQKPQKYDYQGNPVTGSAADKLSAYALVNLSTKYQINKHVQVSAGVDNLFDKRLFRRGNASGVNTNAGNPNMLAGAGAYTYNEPGRSLFLQIQSRF
ncbi:TonB-dependent siderophore receptor [uncultured Paenalcaligenes sp.]|uniref:TonB-dependent siderophore receptor n=1 Tax=uncultured Paenalcaligenes sp. TaxID=1588925 RepID=UPI00260DDC67|nr:TonB-dependent siderophore receptor [uncultured Paenalcaligenes sp.]